MPYSAFEGRVEFHCRHYSPLLAMEDKKLREQLKDAPHVKEWIGWFEDFMACIVNTTEIKFNFQGDESNMLKSFKLFWESRVKLKPTEQWLKFMDIGIKIHDEWVTAVNREAMPYYDPVQVPEAVLTTAEREAAHDLESPLAQVG